MKNIDMNDTKGKHMNMKKTDVSTIKKKKATLIASSLILCLLCVMTAVTYARYVTSATAKDTARIAKWGVEMSAVGTLYGKQYDENGKAEAWNETDKGTVHVSSRSDGNVIAPGTSNTGGLAITLTGTPEVKTNVKVELKSENIYLKAGTYAIAYPVASGVVTEANYETLKPTLYTLSGKNYTSAASAYAADTTYYTLEDKVELTADYYPVVYKSSQFTSSDISSDSMDKLAADIAGRLGGKATSSGPENGVTTRTVSAEYVPGTDLGTTLKMSGESISWEWKYTQDTEGSATELMYSGADTILGSIGNVPAESAVVKASGDNFVAVADNTDYHLKTGLDLTMTVTQVN